MNALLFPVPEPYDHGWLAVGNDHRIWFSQRGNPAGMPVVLIHGGPGSGSSPAQAGFFDPSLFRIVQFDQRGAGRSLPMGELAANRTPLLLSDMEALRRHLAIEGWLVSGGSWGGTLALLYAATHPGATRGVLARGTWRAEKEDVEWFLEGARALRPKAWERFAGHGSERTADGLLASYGRAILEGDETRAQAAALAWATWEHALATGCEEAPPPPADPGAQLRRCRILLAYLMRSCDLEPGALTEAARQLKGIPTAFVHGSEDQVCRLEAARELHLASPESVFRTAKGAGHDPFYPTMAEAMVTLAGHFAQTGGFQSPDTQR